MEWRTQQWAHDMATELRKAANLIDSKAVRCSQFGDPIEFVGAIGRSIAGVIAKSNLSDGCTYASMDMDEIRKAELEAAAQPSPAEPED